MADSSSVETDVDLELYEEIVGNLYYTTPVANKPSRSLSYSEDRTTATTFKEPIITNTSESTVTSASAGIVDPVTWPDPRSSCSLAGNYQVPLPLAQRSDGFPATLAPKVWLESQYVGTFPPDYGPRTVQFQSSTADVDVRPATAPVAM